MFEPQSTAELIQHYAAVSKRLNAVPVPKIHVEKAASIPVAVPEPQPVFSPLPTAPSLCEPSEQPSEQQRRIPRIEEIQRVVARQYNVSRADLLSSRRTANVVRPRQVAMYLAKTLTLRSLPEIGRRFGGRDHTTVLHAVRKIGELVLNDEQFAADVAAARAAVLALATLAAPLCPLCHQSFPPGELV